MKAYQAYLKETDPKIKDFPEDKPGTLDKIAAAVKVIVSATERRFNLAFRFGD